MATRVSNSGGWWGFRRVAGIAGLIFVVFFVLGNLLSQPPKATASSQEIISYFASHQGSQLYVDYLVLVLGFFVVVFAAGVWTTVRVGERERAEAWSVAGFAGAIGIAILLALLAAADAVLARSESGLSGQPALARALFSLDLFIGNAIDPFLALFLAGMSVASLRSRAFPGWTGWVGLLGAALTFVSGLQLVSASPAWAVASVIDAVLILVWLLALSVYMLVLQREASKPATQKPVSVR